MTAAATVVDAQPELPADPAPEPTEPTTTAEQPAADPAPPADPAPAAEPAQGDPAPDTPAAGATVAQLRPSGALALYGSQSTWTVQQRAALVQLGIADAPEGDQQVFLHVCQRTGLDPFARQIYMIARNDRDSPTGKKWSIQTGIDGFRVVAQRSGLYRGQTPVEWCGPDGAWRDVWLDPKKPPAAARVGVLRSDFDAPVWATAIFTEYAATARGGGLTRMWAEKPSIMIAKCAEALALRKAFPQDLSGIYTSDEMSMVDAEAEARPQQVTTAQAAARRTAAVRPTATPRAQAQRPHDGPPPVELPDDFEVMVREAQRDNDIHAFRALWAMATDAHSDLWRGRMLPLGAAIKANHDSANCPTCEADQLAAETALQEAARAEAEAAQAAQAAAEAPQA